MKLKKVLEGRESPRTKLLIQLMDVIDPYIQEEKTDLTHCQILSVCAHLTGVMAAGHLCGPISYNEVMRMVDLNVQEGYESMAESIRTERDEKAQ